MPPPLLAVTLFDFSVSPQMTSVIVPVAAMFVGGIIAITSMYFSQQRKKLWHETARLALEKGQPLPAALDVSEDKSAAAEPRRERNDLRTGLILVAVSAGLWVFLRTIGARDVASIAAIPGFIGVALLLFGIFATFSSSPPTSSDGRPRQP